jgi:hypothetical protein
MNLNQHARVVWKHRTVMAAGVLMGLVLAFLAAFSFPGLERRGTETWRGVSNILVTQKGFPEGRVTLPDQPAAGQDGSDPTGTVTGGSTNGGDDNSQKFADPSRLSSLALLYSVIARSDQVRTKVPGVVRPGQIRAVALDATGNRTTFLPIIELSTTADTAAGAAALNRAAADAFKSLLASEQERAGIEPSERIELNVLDRPTNPTLVQGRSITSSALAFILCIVGAFALIHLLEGMALRLDGLSVRPAREDDGAIPAAAAPGPNGVHARGTTNGHGSHERVVNPTIPHQPGLSSASSRRRAGG